MRQRRAQRLPAICGEALIPRGGNEVGLRSDMRVAALSRASARRDSGFKASMAPRPFPRHGPAAATTGTRAGIRDTDAPGKRDHGELAAKRLS